MDSGTVDEKNETHDISHTYQFNKIRRMIVLLIMLALISLGVFVVLQMILERTP